MKTIGPKQQDRSERAAALLLDNQTQDIQDLLERSAGRDHLEKPFLSCQQSLGTLGLGSLLRFTQCSMHRRPNPR